MPNGTHYSFSTRTGPGFSTIAPDSATDSNGNQILISASGWTDTLGRVVPITTGVTTSDLSLCPTGTASATQWIIPGLASIDAGTRTFILCYGPFTISTDFGQSPVTEYGPTTEQLLNAVVLPDHTSWTFAYDNYGDLTRMGLPTGGSITYTYNSLSLPCSSGGLGSSANSRGVTSRTVDANDGNGGQAWNYNYSNLPTSITVSAPDGNDTVHTFANVGAGCAPF